jgi:hypothetical protein
MAKGLVKVRFLKRSGGTVGTSEVISGLNLQEKKAVELSEDWSQLEAKYL